MFSEAVTPVGRPRRLPTHEWPRDVPLLEFQVMDGSSGEERRLQMPNPASVHPVVAISSVWDYRKRSKLTGSKRLRRLLNCTKKNKELTFLNTLRSTRYLGASCSWMR